MYVEGESRENWLTEVLLEGCLINWRACANSSLYSLELDNSLCCSNNDCNCVTLAAVVIEQCSMDSRHSAV